MDRTLTTFSATKDAELASNLERQAEEQVLAGEVEAAADLYDRALRLRIDGRCPDVFLTAEALARTSNEACCQLSGSRERLLQAERRLQRTLSMLDEILDAQSGVGPSAAPLVSGVHLTLSNLAALHLRAGRKEMALKLLKEAEELGPSIPAAEAAATQLSLCALLSGLRRHIEAERHASEAISLGEADIFQLQNSSETSASLLQDKASTLAVAYNNLAVQREYLGCSDCLALYEKAVVLAEGYMSKDSQLLARLRDSHRTALQTAVERRATASSNRHLSVGGGATVNRRPSSAIETRGVVHVEANRRPSSAIEARGPGKRAESAEAGRRRPAFAARARDGRSDSEVPRSQVRRDSSSSRAAVPSKDRSLLSRELAKLLKPEAQEQASEAASWLPKEKARLPKIQWHESSATSASSSVEDAMNPLPTPALPSHMRFALHQVEAAKPEGKAKQTPSPGKAEETREAPGGQGASPEPALSRQSSKTRRDSVSVFDGRLGAELQRALDFGRCEAARRIQRAYRQHRRLQMVLAQAEQARARRAEATATATGAGPPQASSATAATNLPRPSIPGRMPRPRGAADRDLQGLPGCSLPNLGTHVGPAVASQPQIRREGALPRDRAALDRSEEAPEAQRGRRAAAAATIQVTWKRHRRCLRSWAVLVLQRWARTLLNQLREDAEAARLAKEAAQKAEQQRLSKEAMEAAAKAEEERAAKEAADKAEAEKAKKAEEERLAKEAAEAAATAEEQRAAKEAAEKAEAEKAIKAEEERIAKEAAEAATTADEERAAKEASEKAEAEKAKKAEEERLAKEAAEAAATAEEQRAAKEAAEKSEAEKAKKAEEERVAKEAAEAADTAEKERAAREASEKAEAEKAKKAEEERLAKEAAEAAATAEEQRAAKEAAEKAEAEKAKKAEEERLAKEAAEAAATADEERAANEAAEKAKERIAKEAAEALVNAVAKEAAEAAVKAEEQGIADEAAKAALTRVATETADAAKATKREDESIANQAPEAAEPEKAKAAEEEFKAKRAASEVEGQNAEADCLAKGDQAVSAKDEGELPAKDKKLKTDAAEADEATQDEEERLAKDAAEVVAKADWEQLAKEATDDASAEAQIQQLLEAAVEAAQAKSPEEQEDAAGLSKADPEEELLSKEPKEPQEQKMQKPLVLAATPDAAEEEQPSEAKLEVETDRLPEQQRQAFMPDEAEEGVVVAREAETVPTETSANIGGSAEMQPAEQNARGPEELKADQRPIPAEAEAQLLVGDMFVDSCDEKEPLAEPSAADETTQRLEALEKAIDKEVDRISVRTDDASTEDEGDALLLPECEAWSCAQCGLINEVCPEICVLCEATRSPTRRRGSLAQLASSGAARSKVPPPMRHGPVRR